MDILQMDLNMGKSGFARTLPNDRLSRDLRAYPYRRPMRMNHAGSAAVLHITYRNFFPFW
jgi:hypothetical protein